MNKLTDREKIEVWEKLCVDNNFASTAETQFWLEDAAVFFTNSGSAVATDVYVLTQSSLQKILPKEDGEQLATLVLEFLTGVLQFQDLETERYFWDTIEERFVADGIEIPKEVKPSYLQKYERED